MKFILGQKKQMTQVFKEDGTVIPVTVVEATPNVITQIKTKKKDGYNAVQLGSGTLKKSHSKPQLGHLKDLQKSRWLKEIRLDNPKLDNEKSSEAMDLQMKKFEKGLSFGVEIFRPGDSVSVSGISKGKGFQGVVKRHRFSGAPTSHGTKDQVRMPGSIGATGPAHVFKGMRMPGRMGTDKVTIAGLQIVKVDRENNLLYIKGAVPGAINSLVSVFGTGTFKQPKPKAVAKPEDEASAEKTEEVEEEVSAQIEKGENKEKAEVTEAAKADEPKSEAVPDEDTTQLDAKPEEAPTSEENNEQEKN